MMNLIVLINELYINDKAGSNWSGSKNLLGQSVYLIFLIAVVLFFIYIFIKFTNKLRIEKKGLNNMEIIESVSVSFQNSVQILRVGEKYFIIGVNKDKITFLTEVDKGEIKLAEKSEMINFENHLAENLKKLLKKN